MDAREKFAIYDEMYNKSLEFSKRIRENFESKGLKVYSDFVAVENEEEKTYFCDIEVGGSPETYKRYRGKITESNLEKLATR